MISSFFRFKMTFTALRFHYCKAKTAFRRGRRIDFAIGLA